MIRIYKGYVPGSIGRVVELHGKYYADNWNFGAHFEGMVAAEMAEFNARYDPNRDAIWLVIEDGRVEGSITIDGIHAQREGAHLRWFILSDDLRGKGYGKQLLNKAIQFCKERDYPSVYLRTFEGLHAARKLYEGAGFRLVHQELGKHWGPSVTVQEFTLLLK
jgi:GNAT superfamily N-acetyltransferase